MKITHCPICGYGPFTVPYNDIEEIRYSLEICDCCGCEYGYDDNANYYKIWLEKGALWFNQKTRPADWSLELQIKNIIRPWPPK